jgi:rhamnosyltransferase
MIHNVCAIVTLYYPDVSVLSNITKLEDQVSLVIVADNTPGLDNSELFGHKSKVMYLANKMNLGLSMAFNLCLQIDAVKNSDFILFLDQDSLVPENTVKKLIADYNVLLENKINVGCIGPIYHEKNANKIMRPRIRKALLTSIYRVDSIITSSMLITYSNLQKINFWNEEIFLDLADWDLCFRLNKQGLYCCLTENVVLEHTLGKSAKTFLGLTIRCDVPVRIYYQIRDGLKLLFKTYTPIRYKIKFLFNILFLPIIHFIFLDNKIDRLRYLYFGIIDFFKGKQGPWESRQAVQK